MKKISLIIAVLAFLSSCQEDPITIKSYGRLAGEVLDAESLLPLPGVSVTTNPESDLVITDEFGEFSIDSLVEGSYSIRGRLSGYEDAIVSIQLEGDRLNTVKLLMSKAIDSNSPPNLPSAPQPASGTLGTEPGITLSWSCSDADGDALSYDVYLFASDTTSAIPLAQAMTDTFLNVSGLGFNRKYFWQVIASDGINSPVYGEVWSFSVREYPRDDYRFTFVRPVNNVLTIFGGKSTQNQDLGELSYQLTNGIMPYWRPRLRPVLRDEMAVLHLDGPDVHISIMNRDGTNPRRVTSQVPLKSKDEKLATYCWSPTGDQLLYMNFGSLYRINKDGSGLKKIAEADEGFLFTGVDWTSRNNNIVATAERADNSQSKLYVFQMDSVPAVIQNLPLNGLGLFRHPVFDPTGRKIAFTYNSYDKFTADGMPLDTRIHTYVIGTNGLDLKDLSARKQAGTNDVQPRFIEGGAKILFANKPVDNIGPFKIQTVDVSQAQDLTPTILFENADMPDWN